MKLLKLIILSFACLNSFAAEPDSIIFNNNNYVVGQVKSMSRGVLMMETPYSDKDFAIELDGVKEIYCSTYFLITLTNGDRYYGNLKSTGPRSVVIMTDDGQEIEVKLNDIVIMNDVDQDFWSRLYASIDIGLNITKANDFRQVSMRSTAGYHAKRWDLNAAYNNLTSIQENAENVERTDANIGYRYYLPKDWYLISSITFLSNTEQRLDLRSTLNIGFGKYLVHTNRKYWSIGAGVNLNREQFSSDVNDRNSIESFFGSELNLFDVGDVDLFTRFLAYPSLTESDRWRTDFNFDTKYDLPYIDDFYVKLGFTLNYDNQPVEGAEELDYIFHTGFGWEL